MGPTGDSSIMGIRADVQGRVGRTLTNIVSYARPIAGRRGVCDIREVVPHRPNNIPFPTHLRSKHMHAVLSRVNTNEPLNRIVLHNAS